MAGFDGTITIETGEYRPCLVDGKKALFHRWEDKSKIVEPSVMVGGHGGGVLKYTVAIVEYENGSVAEVFPNYIKFVDGKINEYAF